MNEIKKRKDIYKMIFKKNIKILLKYLREYRPKKGLFSGKNKKRYILIRIVEKIFSKDWVSTEIIKSLTFHSLRHSFPIQPQESATDLRYISEIFVNKRSNTAKIYLHISSKNHSKIKILHSII